MIEMTPAQLDTLRHMLGINTPNDRVPRPYRNYAAVPPGDSEFAALQEANVVEIYKRTPTYDWYRCTAVGQEIAVRSHLGIRRSSGQRRYSAYIRLRDLFPDLTFREFLVDPRWDRARREA